MKERPILFSAPMVRAVLAGTKTQTRRVVKPQPHAAHDPQHADLRSAGWVWMAHDDRASYTFATGDFRCPYGAPGDRLWVRETWVDLTGTHGTPWERRNPHTGLYERGRHSFVWYAADGEQPDIGDGRSPLKPWRPSIHMPRWASRIDLEVTGVRVEQLQDISEADAITEGLTEYFWDADAAALPHLASEINAGTRYWEHVIQKRRRQGSVWDKALLAYKELWTDINGADSWEANPWVWVVEFKRVKP